MPNTVLILGSTGKVGQNAQQAFANAGWIVRNYDRESNDMITAANGVDVIVNGLNPANYHNWSKTIPAITKQVIAAAKASGATVIIPGNVYNFGDTAGIWSENTPHRPNTIKGRVRVEMEQAYRASGVQTIILRAGNFIDHDRKDDMMSLMYFRTIKKHKVVAAGRPDALQAMCYLPDWARAVVQLSQKRASLATFEDIPFPGHSFSVLDVQNVVQNYLGQSIKISGFPWRLFALLGPIWELAREMNEMRYLWNTSHQLSDQKFNRLLPDFTPTDMRSVILGSLPPEMHHNQGAPSSRYVSSQKTAT
jgi:nucleoside-diphosphate-sugar epimerase